MQEEKNMQNHQVSGPTYNPNFDALYKLFTNVNDWLKFAEAKNLMLITFNGVSIYGTLKIFESPWLNNYSWVKWLAFISIVFFVFSAMFCLMSFVPRLRILKGGEFNNEDIKNIWYYETLKNMSSKEVLQNLYDTGVKVFSQVEDDLAEQIVQNSKIASRKYAYFSVALWITISGYITVILAALYFGFSYINSNFQKS
jgi:hypothetical protein